MKSLNTTVEARAREAWEQIRDLTRVTVRIRAARMGHFLIPREDGEEEVEAIFNTFTFGDNYVVEKATSENIPIDGGRTSVVVAEPNEYRRLMLKKNLLWWSLPLEIEREDGWMTPECYARLGQYPGPLVEALVDEFYQTTIITKEEDDIIERQCALLFSDSSRGVSNACEAVSMFCTLGTFWEKFGLNKEDLPDVPFKEYLMLKIMTRKEGDSMRQRSAPKNRHAGTKIAGPGGRTRASRGKRIAL